MEQGNKRGENRPARAEGRGGAFPVWRPAAATLTAAALIGLGFLLFPGDLTMQKA